MSPAHRYAVYYAPAVGSAWWRFGCSWLGRDAARDVVRPPPSLAELDGLDLAKLTLSPRRYGFHATLVAPFALRPDVTLTQLHQHLCALARRLRPVPLGALEPKRLSSFIALRPPADAAPLGSLARECVLALDALRAPLSEGELQRRMRGQDAHGAALVRQHGYAAVMDRFRFHMTLTGDIDPAVGRRVADAAAQLVAPLNRTHPPQLDRICLFVEPRAGAPFRRVADFAFER